MIFRFSRLFLSKFGYKIEKKLPPDIAQDKEFVEIMKKCAPYTMTSLERMYALYQAVNYTITNNLPGDFVECGVWKGGSSMIIAHTLLSRNVTDRKIWLYDTFEGMSAPTEADRTIKGEDAKELMKKQDKNDDSSSIWCYSSVDEVKRNLNSTGYPAGNLHFIQGKVEDTLPANKPDQIALLRLDTDWYESTKIELELLFPLLVKNGVLIIDDFGHWEGAKKAVVEYFTKFDQKPFLSRIDYTGRLLIK